jgi:hypothetical protein
MVGSLPEEEGFSMSGEPEEVTLRTVHEDLTAGFADLKQEVRGGFADLKETVTTGFADLKGELRAGFADLKVTMVAGFRNLFTREQGDEMIRLLRESNRLQEERFTQLDARTREQHLEVMQVLHALAEGQRALLEGQRALLEGQRALLDGQRAMSEEIRSLSADIKALIARLDALIKGRGDGSPSP